MPETLARHFGHLFVRDPLVIIDEFLHPKDENSSYHFEVCVWFFLLLFELKFSLEFKFSRLVFIEIETTAIGR